MQLGGVASCQLQSCPEAEGIYLDSDVSRKTGPSLRSCLPLDGLLCGCLLLLLLHLLLLLLLLLRLLLLLLHGLSWLHTRALQAHEILPCAPGCVWPLPLGHLHTDK